MRLTDYVMAPKELKEQYFSTVAMQVGLRYFGGKTTIGKFLLNRIFEMQAYRYTHKEIGEAKVFVDCFTGGGKMALTIPTGWFNIIVMNDLNYGVYSYYVCCQKKPLALINMIESLGSIMCYDIFMLCAHERSVRGKNLSDEVLERLGIDIDNIERDEEDSIIGDADMLLSAAMTYWVTQGSWLGETDPEKITYLFNTAGKNENEEIRKRIKAARKRIMQINQKMTRQTYIIENMDYVDLIDKYKKIYGESVIWYLDPPYHAATLNKSNGYDDNVSIQRKNQEKPAPYEDSFLYEQTMAMTYMLATMKWFIKSDYDPYYFFRDKYEELSEEIAKEKDEEEILSITRSIIEKPDYFHDFDLIENIEQGFYREYLGSFHKGTNTGHDEGMEVIWTRYDGSQESLRYLGLTDEDIAFWEHKKNTRKKWLYVNKKINNFNLKAIITQITEDERKDKEVDIALKACTDFDRVMKEALPSK